MNWIKNISSLCKFIFDYCLLNRSYEKHEICNTSWSIKQVSCFLRSNLHFFSLFPRKRERERDEWQQVVRSQRVKSTSVKTDSPAYWDICCDWPWLPHLTTTCRGRRKFCMPETETETAYVIVSGRRQTGRSARVTRYESGPSGARQVPSSCWGPNFASVRAGWQQCGGETQHYTTGHTSHLSCSRSAVWVRTLHRLTSHQYLSFLLSLILDNVDSGRRKKSPTRAMFHSWRQPERSCWQISVWADQQCQPIPARGATQWGGGHHGGPLEAGQARYVLPTGNSYYSTSSVILNLHTFSAPKKKQYL